MAFNKRPFVTELVYYRHAKGELKSIHFVAAFPFKDGTKYILSTLQIGRSSRLVGTQDHLVT